MNIICKEHYKKSYYITTQQIIKNGGCCHNTHKWLECAYWQTIEDKSFCRLFTDFKYENKALHICNVIYGLDFIGSP